MVEILLKATGIWFVIVIVAIFNGIFREKILVNLIGSKLALPLSGVLLAILVFLITLIFIPFIGSSVAKTYVWIGLFWLILTLSFEFLFGHFLAKKTWHEIMQVFNIKNGNLFIFVLFVTVISPWLAAKVKRIF